MRKQSLLLLHLLPKSQLPVPRGLEGPMKILQHVQRLSKRALAISSHAMVRSATLPYYRLYQFNTFKPIERIAEYASETHPDATKIAQALSTWRARKLAELQFITVACTVLAAAVIGSFSWTTIEEAYWLTHGFWHSSLIFSILGILLCASEVTVLHLLGPVNTAPDAHNSDFKKYMPLLLSKTYLSHTPKTFRPRSKMVFTWQGPLMFMSYSVCAFLAGLTVLVCTPLIRGGSWTAGHSIAIMYLTVFVGAGTMFIFCSFWVYHYVELESDSGDGSPDLTDSFGMGNMFSLSTEGDPSTTSARQQNWRMPGKTVRHETM